MTWKGMNSQPLLYCGGEVKFNIIIFRCIKGYLNHCHVRAAWCVVLLTKEHMNMLSQ